MNKQQKTKKRAHCAYLTILMTATASLHGASDRTHRSAPLSDLGHLLQTPREIKAAVWENESVIQQCTIEQEAEKERATRQFSALGELLTVVGNRIRTTSDSN